MSESIIQIYGGEKWGRGKCVKSGNSKFSDPKVRIPMKSSVHSKRRKPPGG